MQETQWEDKQDVTNKVVKSSPREQLEELAGGSTEEKDEKQFEHLPKATSGLTDQFDNDIINTLESGPCTTFIQQGIVTGKTPVEKAAVGLKMDAESNNAEEAARGKGVKAVKLQEEQMRSRKNKAGNVSKQKKEESDARLTKHHIDKRPNKNAIETRKHSSLTSEKKKRGIKERQNGKMRTKEAAKKEKGRKEDLTRRTRQIKRNDKEDYPNVPLHKRIDDCLEKEDMAAEQETGEGFSLESPRCFAEKPNAVTSMEHDNVCLFTDGEHSTESSVRSVSSQMSPSASLDLDVRSSLRSSYEGLSADMPILTSSHAQSSSPCSTIMVTEQQLMLELVKTETSRSNEEKTRRQAERAEIRRHEMERRRREQEEVERMEQQERKWTKDNIRNELEEERRRRAEHLRLRKLGEEEVSRTREQEEQERARQEQVERERARRRQGGRRRQMERLQKMREEEARKRNAEVEHLHLEEQRRQEEGCKTLQDMDMSERDEYLALQELQKEDRRTKEEAHQMGEEEQALRAEEMAVLQQQTAFKRGLPLEVEGMGRTQGISRPWVYSYFTLLRLQDLNSTKT
ncbi:trichohyalin-like [Hippocampus zosterae]|uniref:trichohyalin-like n=1 Tax=Hippocampus zosterae TaxID=109293 RepID=UPI00223DC0BB|nr:trichohyalin-like [Hippocampus zosterae]